MQKIEKKLLFLILLIGLATFCISPAHAEPAAGDACSTNGAFNISAETGENTRLLICNGSNWKSALDLENTGEVFLQVNNDAGSCTADKLGRLRYDGTSTWHYCNGTTWTSFGGGGGGSTEWTDDGSGNIYNTDSGKVGIKTSSPAVPLHVNGTGMFGNTSETCSSTIEGGLRYNTTSDIFEFCNGSGWVSIAAAGSGGADQTPDAFSFTDKTNQIRDIIVYSNTLTITGFDGPAVAEITGSASPALSVNQGPGVSSATIYPGDSLRLRQASSNLTSTTSYATVTVGTVSDTLSVGTVAQGSKIFYMASSGNTGGLSGADAICQAAADGAGHNATFKAMLSTTAVDVRDHVTIVYPIVNAYDNTTVATVDVWATGSISGIVKQLNGTNSNGHYIRTLSTGSGTLFNASYTCSDLTSSSGSSYPHGNPWYTNSFWFTNNTNAGSLPCGTAYYIYCISD